MSDVLARLGNVLYWASNIFAGLCVLGGLVAATVAYNSGREVEAGIAISIAVGILFAGVCYLIGRACRYVLAGR